MNMKKILTITILMIFVMGMCISAADAAHTIKYGKYKVKISNKEYKKLNQYETKYKTVTKTRTVEKTKTKEVEVTKTRYYNLTHTETYKQYYDKKNGTSKKGYFYWNERPASKYYEFENKTVNYNINSNNCTYHIYKEEYGKYNTTESYYWTEFVPKKYKVNVTEKYNVKVPYKVRVRAQITKKVPSKYFYYKEPTPIVKNVKVKKTIGKYIYVGKHLGFGLQTPDLRKNMQNNMKNLRAKGWKIHWNKRTGQIGSDGLFQWHCYCTKNVYKKERRVVGYKYKTVKEPIFMSISTVALTGQPVAKGKAIVQIWSHAGPICSGTIKL